MGACSMRRSPQWPESLRSHETGPGYACVWHRKATGGLASWWNGGGSSGGSTRLAAAIVLYLLRSKAEGVPLADGQC